MTNPLSSLKILDFSTLLPGPYATLLLADWGADVIRVEAPNRPDLMRLLPPLDAEGDGAWHTLLNRNKRSLALDLKKPGAAEIVHLLVADYDIVVESFRPGVLDRLGVGFEVLREFNPRLIYCAITGYGQTGPLRQRAGHDLNILALAGILHISGHADSGPMPPGVQIADIGAAFAAVGGILAAVIHRQAVGTGQFVDVSLLDTALAWKSLAAAQSLVGGNEPQPEAMTLNGGSFYDVYRTADGRYFSLAAVEPAFWEGFCRAIDRPDLLASGVATERASHGTLKQQIATTFAARPFDEWRAIFAAMDVCVEPVLTVSEALTQPQVRERAMVVEVPKPGGLTQRQVATPVRFSQAEPTYRHIGATCGEHGTVILTEMGLTASEIAELRSQGVLG